MSEDDIPEKPLSLYADWEGMLFLYLSSLKDGIGSSSRSGRGERRAPPCHFYIQPLRI
jgi:hypothetical protein